MEEVRAKTSQNHFKREGRVWKFSELETFCKDAASCVALCQRLESQGLLVADSPLTYQHSEPSKGYDYYQAPAVNPSSDLQRLKKKHLGLRRRQTQPPPRRDSHLERLSDPLTGQTPSGVQYVFRPFRPVTHLVGHGRQGNRPTEAAVQRVLGKERWTTNRPCVEDLLKAWVPPQQVAGDYEHLLPCLLQQSWKGLSLKDFGQAKGKGVVATMPFSKGEVLRVSDHLLEQCSYEETSIIPLHSFWNASHMEILSFGTHPIYGLQAAYAVMLVTKAPELLPAVTDDTLKVAQEAGSPQEKTLWLERGATNKEGIWYSPDGRPVLPPEWIRSMLKEAHGPTHC
ncbi:hypothetical protein F7725_002733, partial [Dissostichus mawsoni]